MNELERLAALIREQNRISGEIAGIVRRPALAGHVGEFIATHVFDIRLAPSAVERSIDGTFASGGLGGRTVNVKWYGARENLLDITPGLLPHFYLVLSGPRSSAASSRGQVRPWCIESVHLFDARALVATLRNKGTKVGTATSVTDDLWLAAELYPEARSETYRITDAQRAMLQLFSIKNCTSA